MRIIAVDDEKGALRLLLRAVEKELPDCELKGYGDARLAISEAREKVPDVAFLDIKMPEVSGLDMAPLLKSINPKINIIYVTGHAEYATFAFEHRASGYITKPVSREEIRRELENLRNPIMNDNKQVRFVTFGGFDVYVNEVMLTFSYKKTKELLAFLFNKQGAMSTVREIEAALWECDGHESYLRRLKQDLISNMKEAGCDELLTCNRGEIGLNVSEIESDYKDYISGDQNAKSAFYDNYLPQYSWAEPRNASLKKLK